jgi:hypothetical protein
VAVGEESGLARRIGNVRISRREVCRPGESGATVINRSGTPSSVEGSVEILETTLKEFI